MLPWHDKGGNGEEVANPLTDEQSEAQAIDVGRQLRAVAGLQDVSGGISFESCNDQGEPPYRPFVEMSSLLPPGVSTADYARQIADAMVAAGWNDGPPPGKTLYGTVIHQGDVMVELGVRPGGDRIGFQIRGECRNTTDHRNDGKTVGREITDQLNSG